jgi:hypothetical protein
MRLEDLLAPSFLPSWAQLLVVVGLLALAWVLWWPYWRAYRRKEPYPIFPFGKIEPDSLLYPFAKFDFTFILGFFLALVTLLTVIILLIWILH